MRCEVSMSEMTRMSPAVVRYAVESGGALAWRARNVATTAQARLDWTIVWRKKRPPTMSPRAATKARIAGCDTSVHDPPSPTRRRSSTAATGASSGRATSATTSGWTPSAPTSHRRRRPRVEPSVIHASAVRSSGRRSATHVKTTRPGLPAGAPARPASWPRASSPRPFSSPPSWSSFSCGALYNSLRTGVNNGMRTLIALALVLLAAAPLVAQTLDPTAREALVATLRMLRDPALRAPAVAGNSKAEAIDAEVQSITGSPELAQEFYDLAARIFEELMKSSDGDTNKMREALESGAKDPAAFASLLSPATLDRLRALAVKISDRSR